METGPFIDELWWYTFFWVANPVSFMSWSGSDVFSFWARQRKKARWSSCRTQCNPSRMWWKKRCRKLLGGECETHTLLGTQKTLTRNSGPKPLEFQVLICTRNNVEIVSYSGRIWSLIWVAYHIDVFELRFPESSVEAPFISSFSYSNS